MGKEKGDMGLLSRSRLSTLVSCAVLMPLGAVLPSASQAPMTIVLNGASAGHVFDGIGALSAGASSRLLIDYPEPQRSQILDYLFKPNYGAALQHLKVEVGGDVNSTDGSEPSHMRRRDDHNYTRGYEWWLMTEARKRNPRIILDVLPWGAPGWVGGGKLYSEDMANYMADFIQGAERVHHLDIAYTGIWNEKVYDARYVKTLHRVLAERHLPVRIVCCDEYDGQGAGQWAIAEAMNNDPELKADVDVIGVHYPHTKGMTTTTEAARQSGKPLWSSEDQPNSGSGPYLSRDWPIGGRILAHLYNENYLKGGMTKTEIWSPITSYYDNLAAPNSGLMYANTPWSGHFDVQGTIWATAHTTQFAQPGWQYLDSSSGYLPEKGTYVALRSPDKKNWSVVLETIDAKNPQKVLFRLEGGLTAAEVRIWETNNARTFEHVADIKPEGGSFEYTFDPDSLYSLTTTTGQSKGAAQPPAPKSFPFPYADDFDTTPLKHSPKFLSDQDGAFEVRACNGRPGQCLEQVITEKPVAWSPLPDPFTLVGNDTWTDYSVSVEVRFLSKSPAVVMGRIDSADVFKEEKARWPSGYLLRVNLDGTWELLSAEFKKPVVTLGSGSTALDSRQWHRLELTFRGQQIRASIDGKPLSTIDNTAHTHGMVALGTEWDHVQFDNLSVKE